MRRFIILFTLVFFSVDLFGQNDYFITSKDGVRLYVQEFGKGEPVIMLAGGPGLNPGYLKGIWDNLSTDFRCIVLNQRGTGQSVLPVVDSVSMSMDNYVNDLEVLRDHLNLKHLTLLGHSWGGMLSMVYLAKQPGNVKKLLLVDPGGPSNKFTRGFSQNLGARLLKEDRDEMRKLDSLGLPTLKAIWPAYFYDRNRGLATKPEDPKANHGQDGIFRFATANYYAFSDTMMAKLKETTVPVYLIQGRQDPIGESTAMEIKEVLPQTVIHFIEACGHLPWLENEAQVTEFFESIRKELGSTRD